MEIHLCVSTFIVYTGYRYIKYMQYLELHVKTELTSNMLVIHVLLHVTYYITPFWAHCTSTISIRYMYIVKSLCVLTKERSVVPLGTIFVEVSDLEDKLPYTYTINRLQAL